MFIYFHLIFILPSLQVARDELQDHSTMVTEQYSKTG